MTRGMREKIKNIEHLKRQVKREVKQVNQKFKKLNQQLLFSNFQ